MRARSEFCHNCGIRLTGPFCAACGQKDVPLTVTLHDFGHELTHEMLQRSGAASAGRDADAENAARKLGFENIATMQDALDHAILAWIPRVMFVLLPLFAWLVAVVYRRIDGNYLHHLIFAVHVHAAWFAAGTVAKVVELAAPRAGQALLQIVPVLGVVYAVLAFRRVYGKVRYGFARMTFVLATYVAVLTLAFAAIVMPVILRQSLIRPA